MSKSKLITLTDEMQVKLKELQQELGFPSETMVIYSGIMTLYQKTFPPHTQAMRKTPRDLVRDKQKEKEAREELDRERKIELVRALDGKIITDNMGEVAHYYTYAGRKRYKQETPLHLVTEEIVASQYSPDRATVELLQKEKKVEY